MKIVCFCIVPFRFKRITLKTEEQLLVLIKIAIFGLEKNKQLLRNKFYKRMKKLISILAFTLLFTSLSYGQDDKTYTKAIKRMYEVMGTDSTFKKIINQSISMYKAKYPKEKSWNDVETELNNTSLDEMINMLSPVYKKYLTLSDIEEITRFYETPVGKKYIKSMPAITEESMKIGQQLGKEIELKINKKIIKSLNKKE